MLEVTGAVLGNAMVNGAGTAYNANVAGDDLFARLIDADNQCVESEGCKEKNGPAVVTL